MAACIAVECAGGDEQQIACVAGGHGTKHHKEAGNQAFL